MALFGAPVASRRRSGARRARRARHGGALAGAECAPRGGGPAGAAHRHRHPHRRRRGRAASVPTSAASTASSATPPNLASRIEGLTKEMQTRDPDLGETAARLGPEFRLGRRAVLPVKGKDQPVEVVEVLAARRRRARSDEGRGLEPPCCCRSLIVVAAALLRIWHLETRAAGAAQRRGDGPASTRARCCATAGSDRISIRAALGQPAGPVYFTALLFSRAAADRRSRCASRWRCSASRRWRCTYRRRARDVRPYHRRVRRRPARDHAVASAPQSHRLHGRRLAVHRDGDPVGAVPCPRTTDRLALRRRRRAARASACIPTTPIHCSCRWLAVPFLYDLAGAARPRGARRRWLARTAAAALVAPWPSAADGASMPATHEEYFWHQRRRIGVHMPSVARGGLDRTGRDPGRRAASNGARALLVGGRPDDGDGLGRTGYPLLDPLTSLAAGVGLVMALRGWRARRAATLARGVGPAVRRAAHHRRRPLSPHLRPGAVPGDAGGVAVGPVWRRPRLCAARAARVATAGGRCRRCRRGGAQCLRLLRPAAGASADALRLPVPARCRGARRRAPAARLDRSISTATAGAPASRPSNGTRPRPSSSIARASSAKTADRTRRSICTPTRSAERFLLLALPRPGRRATRPIPGCHRRRNARRRGAVSARLGGPRRTQAARSTVNAVAGAAPSAP